jgi:two-component system, cell cycle sensor histidine kinase and response regulator CckA
MTTILLVDDQVEVRTFIRRLLLRNGYEVIEAESGEAALRSWADHGARVDLVITDLSMPGGMSGDALARQLLAQKPNLRIVFTSGYGAYSGLREPRLVEGQNFIPKPSTIELMLRTISFALSTREGEADGEPKLEP